MAYIVLLYCTSKNPPNAMVKWCHELVETVFS